MSAMRAEELPELPDWLVAPSPRDSAVSRAAALWTAPQAPDATRPDATRPPATRPRPANPPLRLTRRGRIVVAVAAALVLSALSLVIASAAQATSHPVPRAARQSIAQVAVRPGQNLWSVAESADPAADTRVVIQRIIDLNGLTGNTVFAGERLWVPRG